ncbi:MAG: hypothetical protein M1821_008916 [Bathelium mastoideum]|nr:MAG: hypothetical protein M1821_008916 [Bathelium mastoideum]
MGDPEQEKWPKELEPMIARMVGEQIKLQLETDLPKWQSWMMQHLKDQLVNNAFALGQQAGCARVTALEGELNEKVHEINKLEAENNSLMGHRRRLEQEVIDWRKKTQSNKAKAIKLQNILLEQGLGEEPPADDQVVRMFSQLRQRILQLIKTQCLKQDAEIPVYQQLPMDIKDWWVMKTVCDVLYDHFFSPTVMLFGFENGYDDALAYFEAHVAEDGKVPPLDLVEWRIRSVQLAKFYHNHDQADSRSTLSAEAVEALFDVLKPFMCNTTDANEARRLEQEQGVVLGDICAQAFQIALLFRATKTQYVWSQTGAQDANMAQLEILGTWGLTSSEECAETLTIFGTVMKGGGPHERVLKKQLLFNHMAKDRSGLSRLL